MTQALTPCRCTLLFTLSIYNLYLSLSVSLSMARGKLFPAGLTAALVVLVILGHQTCSAEDSRRHHCSVPSSYGTILNISHPFRLYSDPENCGDPRYNLSCEKNQTVLYLKGRRYYVRQINYSNYTIRVVDPGIVNDNDPLITIPPYFLDGTNFSSGDPYQASTFNGKIESNVMIFVKCEKPLNSLHHLNISGCLEDDGVYSSKRHRYVLFRRIAGDIGDLCKVEQIYLPLRSSYHDRDELRNISCTDFHNELLQGFELFWYPADCRNCRDGICYLNRHNNVTCNRHRYGA
jgi:hypothetical protein